MKIPTHQIQRIPSHFTFTQKDTWLYQALLSMDEAPRNPKDQQAIRVEIKLSQESQLFLMKGKLETHLHLLCSRCGHSFLFPCQSQFTTFYSHDPSLAGMPFFEQGTLQGKRAGSAYSKAHSLSTDMDIVYLSEKVIDLQSAFIEQMRLQIPSQPLCQKNCPSFSNS